MRPVHGILAAVAILVLFIAGEHFISGVKNAPVVETAIPVPAADPAPKPAPPALEAERLVASDGTPISAERLRGRWTMLFTPTEPCVDACARVLESLRAVSRDPASGVADGVAQIFLTRAQGGAAREIVVLDPEGHPAGLISHTNDPGRIVSGLATLRASFAATTPVPVAAR
jgi:hypothetical protein